MQLKSPLMPILAITLFVCANMNIGAYAFDYNSENPKAVLDSVNEKSINFLNNHNTNYVLHNASAGDSDIALKIGNTTYYFTPDNGLSENELINLKNLVNIGYASLVETDESNAMFSIIDANPENNKYYKYNKETLPVSSITYSVGNQNNYTFKIDVPDNEGNIQTKYYIVNHKDRTPTLTRLKEFLNPSLPKSAFSYKNTDETKTSIEIVPENIGNNVNVSFENTTSEDASPNKVEIKFSETDKRYLKYNVDPAQYDEVIHSRQTSVADDSNARLYNAEPYSVEGSALGGALYNNANVENIVADFIGNTTESTGSTAYGGGLYNNGTIDNIAGDFIGNIAQSNLSFAYGGGVSHYGGTITNLTGDFIGNSAIGKSAYGGGVSNNYGTITNLTGDFIGNSAQSNLGSAYGGGVSHYGGTITNFTGDVIGNSAIGKTRAEGGGVYNGGTLTNFTGDVIGNSAESNSGEAGGGGVFNKGTITNYTGDVIGNSAIGATNAYGGGVYNKYGTITNFTGDVIGNSAQSNSKEAQGGGVYNNKTITNFTGDVIGNSAIGKTRAEGGGVYNSATITNYTGDVIGNSAQSNSKEAQGGGVWNNKTITNFTGDVIGNSV